MEKLTKEQIKKLLVNHPHRDEILKILFEEYENEQENDINQEKLNKILSLIEELEFDIT
jgi:aspartate/glutamate racemase